MENSEKKYEEAIKAIKKLQEANPSDEGIQNWVNDNFPELKESEDERIRKEIISIIRNAYWTSNKDRFNELVAWLEKQKSVEGIVERCKKSWYNEGKIAGMAEGLTNDEKYQQGWHDALEKLGEKKSQDESEIERLRKAINKEKVDNSNKIENTRPMLSDFFNAEYKRGKTDALKCIKWSEEDEKMIDEIIDYIKPIPIFFESTKGKSGKEYTKEFIKNATKWLKSLKERIVQQKQK